MSENLKELLLKQVIFQIKEDIDDNYMESLHELLSYIPVDNLICYLPEEDWEAFKQLSNDPS